MTVGRADVAQICPWAVRDAKQGLTLGQKPFHIYVWGGHSAVVTLRRQLSGVGSLPPQYKFQRVNSDH